MPPRNARLTAGTSRHASSRHDLSSRRRHVSAELTYDYAIVRVVPRVDRGEQINVGVILSVADSEFLEARIELDETLLRSLEPAVDVAAVREQLDLIVAICRGGAEAGPI